MTEDRKLANIRECPLFSGLSEPELEKVAAIAKVKKFPKNSLIFSQGEPADGFYTVASGKVKVFKLAGDGRQHILHMVQKGGVFAEAAVFSGISYPAYSETLLASELFYFSKDKFYALLKNNPQISLNMLATLSKYLRRFSHQIEQLSLKDVSARLAQYILVQSEDFGGKSFELKMKKGELASRLGTVSETLSRSFNKLKKKKIIDVKGKYIYILDRDSLAEIAKGDKI